MQSGSGGGERLALQLTLYNSSFLAVLYSAAAENVHSDTDGVVTVVASPPALLSFQ